MTKSFDDVVSNYKDPSPEWTVTINGKNYTNQLELLEFTDSVNNPLKFTIKLSGVNSSDSMPEDAEVIVSRSGGELFRGVLKEVEPNVMNTYTFKGTGYAAELEGDVDQKFEGSTVSSIVDSLIGGTTTNTNVPRTFSTSYDISSTTVEDFRAKKDQLGEVNRLMGEYELEWYTTYDGSNEPVFNVTSQISFNDGGSPLGTLTTYGSNQTAEMVKQNANRNKGDFDGVVVRGYGDGEDQITATSGSTGKGNRVLIYTDKTIVTESQAQQRADNINSNKSVSWQEIEVKPNDPNKIYGVGDELNVDSKDARLNDTYRVVRSYFKIWPGEDQFESTLNLSNKPQTFIDDFKKQENQTDSQTDYMQGSRNVWGEKETTNATNAEPITIDFYIPPDVKDDFGKNRTKKIALNYSCSAFRKSSTNSQSRVSSTNLTKSNKMDSTSTSSSDKMDSTSTDDDDGLEESSDNEVQMETVEQEQAGTTGGGGAEVIEQTDTAGVSDTINLGDGWQDLEDSNGQIDFDFASTDSAGGTMYYQFDMDLGFEAGSDTVGFVDVRVKREFDNVYFPGSGGRNHLMAINDGDQVGKIEGTIEVPENTNGEDYIIQVQTRISTFDTTIGQIGMVVYGTHVHDVSPNHKDSGGGALLSPGNDGNLSFNTDNFIYDITDNTSGTVDDVTDNTSSTTDDVTDNTQSTVVSVNDDILVGTTANEIDSITVDGTERINDIYGQSTSNGVNQDSEIDITDYLNSDSDGLPSVGWHTVEITPDGATFLKSRVFLDHKKDN